MGRTCPILLLLLLIFALSTTQSDRFRFKIKINPVIVSVLDSSSAQSCILKLHSILKSAHYPKNLLFKFVIIDDSKANGLSITTWNNMVAFLFPGIDLETKMWNSSSLPISGALRGDHFEKDVIFVRFYLAEIFPDLQKFVYLDNDIIVTMDISDMYMHLMEQSCDSAAFHLSEPPPPPATDKQSRSSRTIALTKEHGDKYAVVDLVFLFLQNESVCKYVETCLRTYIV